MAANPEQAPLELRIEPAGEGSWSRTHLPVRLTFTNVSGGPVRLMTLFDPFPVFFAASIVREDGTPIHVPGGGKIELQEGVLTYAELAGGESHALEYDLATLVPDPAVLTPGRYSISVVYHNQYGEACFRGRLHSNTIEGVIQPG